MDWLTDFEFWKVAIPSILAAIGFGWSLWKAYKTKGLRGLVDAFINAGESEQLRKTVKKWTEENFDEKQRALLDRELEKRGLLGASKKEEKKS